MEQIYLDIWELAKIYYQKGRFNDIPHVEWMMKKAEEISGIEKADKRLLLPIVILHDVGYSVVNHRNPNVKDKNSKTIHMREGAIIAREILDKVGYDEEIKNTTTVRLIIP